MSRLLIFYLLLFIAFQNVFYSYLGDCSFHIEAPSVKKTSYIGWPVSLNCDVLEPQMVEVLREEGQNSFYASDDDDYGAHEIQVQENHSAVYSAETLMFIYEL